MKKNAIENKSKFVEPFLPHFPIGIMHLAAGIWSDGKDMRVDKSIKIDITGLYNRCSQINISVAFWFPISIFPF